MHCLARPTRTAMHTAHTFASKLAAQRSAEALFRFDEPGNLPNTAVPVQLLLIVAGGRFEIVAMAAKRTRRMQAIWFAINYFQSP